ncbi:MAG: CpaF family protein [Sphingomonadales bacterium]|nr:MAG: CpaF family protein [Sphingomonadales bacterium]
MRPVGFGRRNAAQPAPGGLGGVALGGRRPLVSIGAEGIVTNPAPALDEINDGTPASGAIVDQLYEVVEPLLADRFPAEATRIRRRGEVTDELTKLARETAAANAIDAREAEIRDVVTVLLNDVIDLVGGIEVDPIVVKPAKTAKSASSSSESVLAAKERVHPLLIEHIDASVIAEMDRGEVADQISDIVGELLLQEKLNLNTVEQRDLISLLLNDMLGLGPLEPLLADEAVTDIMINGANQIFVERKGKLELTDVRFRDEQHLFNIAQRIVAAIGRRVDESQPLCDARLLDGSRVNVVIPPLAIDGTSISIRKFSKRKITLEKMAEQGNISPKMCRLLQIAGRCRLNMVISGGTGSGKTTMLNAVSRNIDPGERVVTIEDAAELQLQQPHVVRLETRPANLEGRGEITMRDLVKNALRMRPDRIILGEVRGPEAVDLLQAMNTGHDGSLGTLHANRPREALTRLENMINMAGLNLPPKAIREQIASAVNMIVQVSRMRDGVRRVTYISEIVGMEGDVIVMQDLYTFKYTGEDESGRLVGDFVSSGLRPAFFERAEYYGLGRAVMECL